MCSTEENLCRFQEIFLVVLLPENSALKKFLTNKNYETRKHSSRMCTARFGGNREMSVPLGIESRVNKFEQVPRSYVGRKKEEI